MTEFELQTSGVGIENSTNWAVWPEKNRQMSRKVA